MWTALFFPLSFTHDWGLKKGPVVICEGQTLQYLSSPITYFSTQTICWQTESTTSIQPMSTGWSHTFTRRNAYLEDVVTPTRQRRSIALAALD